MFRECFGFNCKINFRNFIFLLAAAASVIFSVISQLPYFEHYQLTNTADLQAISDRMWIDATVPTNNEERIQLITNYVQDILTGELKSQNSHDIIADLQERLSEKNDWTVGELDTLWAELTMKYSELKMLTSNHLSNAYINNFRKTVTQDELFRYAYSENNFSSYLSVEFGESLSLVISILFIIFFSTVFLGDVKRGITDILHINVAFPRKMIYAKYLSALVMVTGCICLDIMVVNIMQLLYVKDVTLKCLLVVWGNTFLYCIPTIVFLSTISVMLCVLFKNAILGVAALLIANLASSFHYILPNGSRRQLPFAPFIFNLNSFFDSVSRDEFTVILLNRVAFCLIGVIMLELTIWTWNWVKRKGAETSRRISRPQVIVFSWFSPKSFFFYNAKIILNKVKLAAVFIILALSYVSINANTDITNMSRSILMMTGWASVILFSNIKSVEHTDNTTDLYRMSVKGGAAVSMRFLICEILIALFTSAVFLLSLLRIDPMTYHFEYMMNIFSRMTISCLTCASFLGSVTMTLGYVLKKTWLGLAAGLVVNVLLSQIKSDSIFNLYLFYYFPENESNQLWIVSILFYTLISLAILLYNIFCSRKLIRHSKVK